MDIFQKNDIRGVFGENLTLEEVYRIGSCLPKLLKAAKMVICRDMRSSSDALFSAVAGGISDAGCEVLNIGRQETPAFYFAVDRYEAEGGVMITASHNPPEYNGLKIVGRHAYPMDSENGFEELKECRDRGGIGLNRGRSTEFRLWRGIHADYLGYLRSFLHGIGAGRIVIDCSHGMAGVLVREVFQDTSIETVLLNERPDGTFPVHGPNPMKLENLEELKETVRSVHADLGVCFDGDADRVVCVDSEGHSISPDIITALLAKYLLRHRQGQKGEVILYDLRSSMGVPEYIEKCGGRPFMCPIGHSRIKRLMRQHNALLGGELTGHYYFRENNFCDSGWITLFYILSLMEAEQRDLMSLSGEVGGYFFSGEINYTVKDKKAVFASLSDRYHDGTQSRLDGLRVEYPEWWFIVRESTTESYLRLVVEAKEARTMERRRKELEELIITVGDSRTGGELR